MRRDHLHAPRHFGDRASDRVAALIGSWSFVLAQLAIIILWFAWNTLLPALAWDRYPFTFLNLFLSCEAAFATSLILISQNRQAAIDRARDDHEAAEVSEMHALNRTELSILDVQTNMLKALQDNAEAHAAMLAAIKQLTAEMHDRKHGEA